MSADPVRLNPALAPPGVGAPRPTPAAPAADGAGASFEGVLRAKLDQAAGIRFSGHALERLKRRGIDVGEATMNRLEDGVSRASAKGAREALVLIDGTAFVVSVRNRTVITAVGADQMRDRVFTNIDSAVIN
ncbi:MAG: TIGR02530 family flagellar biosynthesis protein [Gaiellales bacterium]|jgi:flagellar operon protein